MTIDSIDLQNTLGGFTGTERWYRTINRSVTYTDGVKYFADKAGSHWLLDILATELPPFVREHGMVFASATRKEGERGCLLSCVRDTGDPPLWSRKIELTDLPVGEWPLWLGEGGPEGTTVIMLPSEY